MLDASSYMEPYWASLYESCVYPALSFLDLPRSKPDAPVKTEYAMVAHPANQAGGVWGYNPVGIQPRVG